MRALFILDRDFTVREHAMIRRIEVGLLDEGVRLTRCVPQSCALVLPSGLIPQAVYADKGPRIALPWRADRLQRELARLESTSGNGGGAEPEFDVVHAWGSGCWDLAADIAESTDASLVLEVYSSASLERASRIEGRVSSVLREAGRVVLGVPNEPMARAAERIGIKWAARVLAWGVFLPESARPQRRPGAPASVCVIGSGETRGAAIPVLESLAELARRREKAEAGGAGNMPEVLAFVDERLVAGDPDAWRYAERLGLLSHVSVSPSLEAQREPVLRADLLLIPEASGFHTSLALDAMAAGLAVIAARDELRPELIDESTAVIVDPGSARAWADAMERLLNDPARAAHLGESARQFVATHRLASGHVGAVLDLYRRLAGGPLSMQAP